MLPHLSVHHFLDYYERKKAYNFKNVDKKI